MADGYVCNNVERGAYYLGIELSSVDENHLEKFAECIGSDSRITRRTRILTGKNGENSVHSMSIIRIYSKYLVNSLSLYGVVPDKTHLIDSINIRDEFMWDFVRGYFDGDGSFSYSNIRSSNGTPHMYPRIGFVCYRKEFLLCIQRFLSKNNITSHINSDRHLWTLSIREGDSVRKFCNGIYHSEKSVRLLRKYEKYKNFFRKMQ